MKTMKNFLITTFFCLILLPLCAEPAISWSISSVDADLAEVIKEKVNEKLANISDKQIFIKLTQNDNQVRAEYEITPGTVRGTVFSDNIWNEVDIFSQQLVNAILPHTPQPTVVEQPYTAPLPVQQYPQQAVQHYPQQPSAQPHINNSQSQVTNNRQQVGLGGCMDFGDGTRGIVFYVDHQGHGLAVSLFSTIAKWENVSRTRDCHDIMALPNEDGTKSCTYGLGKQNTTIILNQLGNYNAPAAAWCNALGQGWYLPSAGELWYLLEVANGKADVNGMISMALLNIGATPLSDNWYWSSTENDDDEAINVSSGGRMSSEDKNEPLEVRAIRAF